MDSNLFILTVVDQPITTGNELLLDTSIRLGGSNMLSSAYFYSMDQPIKLILNLNRAVFPRFLPIL